ncbi:MAG: chemotaxis protein CheB [Planctomycetota bacterium]
MSNEESMEPEPTNEVEISANVSPNESLKGARASRGGSGADEELGRAADPAASDPDAADPDAADPDGGDHLPRGGVSGDGAGEQAASRQPDAAESAQSHIVVGIGASAGGLDPLQQFFDELPSDTDAAFVVVQHLSPDFESLMAELLARHTSMRVSQIEDGVQVEPNCVYLIPPKHNVTFRDGALHLQAHGKRHRSLQFPIDEFFRSLATQLRERAVAVVLSGAGTDGARGAGMVNEEGGLVLVQAPDTAQFDGMPRGALTAAGPQAALSPVELAHAVTNYLRELSRAVRGALVVAGSDDPIVLRELIAILRTDSTIDFGHYRSATISRRVSRRIMVLGVATVSKYLDRLRDDAAEREALRNDLLIGVTGFFRDRPAWEKLEAEILQPIVEESQDRAIRCWVTACSTGEEVYSLAIALCEIQERLSVKRDVKIFATDIDKRALEAAASGLYTDLSKADVPAGMLEKYFVAERGSLRVRRSLREMVIFAEHNLSRDAPFTNMDLVTCRNALIYMEPSLQRQVLSTLHFSLRVSGALFLGASESCGALAVEFEPVDVAWRIYRKKRDTVLRVEGRRPSLSIMHPIVSRPRTVERVHVVDTRDEVAVQSLRALLHDRRAAVFLIDDDNQLLHVYGKAELFTRVPEGAGGQVFTRILLPELAVPFGAAQQRARQLQGAWRYSGIQIGEAERHVDLCVVPVDRADDARLELVVIEERQHGDVDGPPKFTVEEHVSARIQSLERDLQDSRDALRSTARELEAANQEHQATTEELMASNEELQSTNEELQSVNEELHMVNVEHQSKIRELTRLNSDIDHLLRHSFVATMFLGERLQIRKYTPGVQVVVNVTEHDVDRPVNDLSHKLVDCDLYELLKEALDSGESREQFANTVDGKQLVLRIFCYDDTTDGQRGVLLTALDAEMMRDLLGRVDCQP